MVDSGTYDEATLARRYAMAQALLKQPETPIKHWAQGLNQLAEGALGGYQMADLKNEANTREAKGRAELFSALGLPAPATAAPEQVGGFQRLASILNGGGGPAAPVTPVQQAQPMGQVPGMAPQSAPIGPNDASPLDTAAWPAGPLKGDYASAIAGIESGGKYDKLGPMTKGDRAYGKYQVMGANVPEWTQAALGQKMTPDQFLASPEAQDAVFKQRFGQYVDKYGPEGAAKAWFAGEKGMNNPNAKDVLGTSVAGYGSKFMNALGGQGGEAPASQAIAQALQGGASGAPTTAPVRVASADGAVPAAGGGGILAGVPTAQRAQIAQLLTSNNPTAKALGTSLLTQAMKPNEFGFQTQPDGTILRTDPRKGTVEPIYQGATKPTFGIIGETEDGKKTYGFIDSAKGKVTPLELAKPGDERPTVTGPDGKEIVIPKGVDVKAFKTEVTKASADAATGKKTEVQGSAEQFANRLETAEKNFAGLGNEASGISGAAQTVAGKIPVVGSAMQSSQFQKMEQAKSQFITALLRKESGAAIGKEEFNRYDKEFFPQPGDKPEVKAQKAEARQVAIDAMKKTAGPGYKSPTATVPAVTPVTKSIGGKEYYQENGQWYEK